jgi:hypothetical protein
MAGGTQPIVEGGYELLYLPDVNNNYLQAEGKNPVFYWIPNRVRMARKDGPDQGDFLFNLLRFSGVQGPDTTVGATDNREVAGGLLTFTITGAVPDNVLQTSQQKIIDMYAQSGDFFWGIRGQKPPIFRPAIITSNVTTVSNVSPNPRGLSPVLTRMRGGRNEIRAVGIPPHRRLPAVVRASDARDDSNLDPWYWHMQGEGTGSIDPSGQHAFSALLGAYPTAILWESFHGTASPVTVNQLMKLKVWSPVVSLRIDGHWDKVFEHFSAAASARYLWASADVKVELNKMRQNGTITVDLKVDPTIPNGEKIAESIDKRSDMVFDKFMEAAQKVIFEPKQPDVKPAEASSGGGPWGVGLALKYRRDETSLDLHYEENRQLAYLQEHGISSSLAGMYEEMHRDPEAERKYFRTVYLDDWPRKLARVVKPVAAWSDKTVEFLSVEIGYPNTQGEIMWAGHAFSKPSGGDDSWKFAAAQKIQSDVQNPPEGWTPDKTFIKRKVHLAEPPSETENPYVRVQIDKNEINIDPEPNGQLLNDTTIEVRADTAGRLAVGPITLGVVLQDNTQTVTVTFEPTDDKGQPVGRDPVRFVWNHNDYDKDRLWLLYTGDPGFQPYYRYKVKVLVKGTIFEPGREWEGPWVNSSANGTIIVSIPPPNGRGVSLRQVPVFAEEPVLATREQIMLPEQSKVRIAPALKTVSGWGLSPKAKVSNRR